MNLLRSGAKAFLLRSKPLRPWSAEENSFSSTTANNFHFPSDDIDFAVKGTAESMIVVLMGVTGSGKTTAGKLLSRELGWKYYDADDFHLSANLEKMPRDFRLTMPVQSGTSIVAFPFLLQGRHPEQMIFRTSIASLNVPLSTLRPCGLLHTTHDSGPLWLSKPLTCESFVHYNLPVYPGAKEIIMKRVILCLSILTLSALTLAGQSFSPSGRKPLSGVTAPTGCSVASLIMEHVNWLKQKTQGGTNVVRVTAASNQKNRVVTYAEGELKITGSPFPSGAGQPPPTGPYTLGGTLIQYFSDRKFTLPAKTGLSLDQYPFSPQKTDQLGISISTTGNITLTLKSWGNTNLNLTGVDCASGVLYGLTNTNPSQSLYVISLSKDFQANAPIIK